MSDTDGTNCPICKMGVMKPGFTTVVLTRGESTVVFKRVPALICDDCGEYFLDELITKDVYERAESGFASGQEVAISTFAFA